MLEEFSGDRTPVVKEMSKYKTMLFCNLRTPLSFIYQELNILDDMYELEMAKFMYKLLYNELSKIVQFLSKTDLCT